VRSGSEAHAVNAGENSRRVSVARALPSPNIDENAMLVLSALGPARADFFTRQLSPSAPSPIYNHTSPRQLPADAMRLPVSKVLKALHVTIPAATSDGVARRGAVVWCGRATVWV
jgi:hypothetical protein